MPAGPEAELAGGVKHADAPRQLIRLAFVEPVAILARSADVAELHAVVGYHSNAAVCVLRDARGVIAGVSVVAHVARFG
jgi:hypothetical protein